jgi:uncharacterized protein (TIGR02099 family)
MTMHALRKGCLVLLAWCLGTLAVLLLVLRLLASQADALTPHIEAFLQTHLDAPVSIETLSVAVEREGLSLEVQGVRAELPDAPLFSLDTLRLRLDVWRSLRALAPVFSQARMDGFRLHLYRGEGLAWQWPEPAKLPLYFAPEPTVDLDTIDAWTRLILRQRLWVTDTRVMMHDGDNNATLNAPELMLSGSEKRIRLAGSVAIASPLLASDEPSIEERASDEPTRQESSLGLPAASFKADVRPGSAGLKNFSAALQLDMQLEHLTALAELIRPDYVPQLALAGGRSRLWARWQSGRLEDARLQLDIPEIVLSQAEKQVVLNKLHARGQWRREGDGGEAWLSGDVEGAKRVDPDRHKAPTLPKRWHLTHQAGDWQLRTSGFELDSLAAWGDYVVLPESLTRPLQALAPRGQVTGLQIGQQNGEWCVDAALHDLAVSPWDEAPGGGPVDAWVEARDLRGRVAFSGGADSTLNFPEIFNQPMRLERADGEVQWVYDGSALSISGKRLRAQWNGARVQGEFGLTAGGPQEQLGLDLAFQNVDAVNHPLVNWLPMKAFDNDLREWLANGVSGHVEDGTLKIATPIAPTLDLEDINTTLELDVTQGSLPIAPGWPQLSDIQGHLRLDQNALEANVAQVQSHGVRASDGQVDLDVRSGQLRISGALDADADALRAFFLAAPALGAADMLEDIQAEGAVQGDVELALALDDIEALTLDISASPQLEQLTYTPLGVDLNKVRGDIVWQQRGEQGALLGTANAELLGGDISADFTPDQVALNGNADIVEWLGVAGMAPDAAAQLAAGRTRWQGTLDLGESPSLRLESDLEGVRIKLPAPFAKTANARWPWTLEATFADGRIESRLSDVAYFRGRLVGERLAGNLNLGTQAARPPAWPSRRGWQVNAGAREIAPLDWRSVAGLLPADTGASERGRAAGEQGAAPLGLSLDTPCVKYRGKCLGSVAATGQRRANGEVDLALDGSVLSGNLRYRPGTAQPLDVTVGRLVVDKLLALPEARRSASQSAGPGPENWLQAVKTRVPAPAAMPEWLTDLPAGRLRVADIVVGEKRFGPLTAYWQAGRHQFTLAPVGLTLGELSARGELSWSGSSVTSQTRADLTLAGGDVGTALARLDQPIAMRSESTQVAATLEWPGAPWQFALSRAGGNISTDIRDGRFVTLDSPSARLVGLLNFDNILRRLRLDFSDVTGKGTAFNRVHGEADVAGGLLRLRGPLTIDAPATTMRLTGSVDLLERELDQRLGVTLPISQSLPLAALAAGAPVVGGALFVAHTLFGDALERATTIHYRLEGPWASPDITLEGSQ